VGSKRKITIEGFLRWLDDEGELMFPTTRKGAYKRFYNPKILNLEDYFPSEIIRAANRLERKGLVTKEEMEEGTKVKITNKGKSEILMFNLRDLKPKTGTWDGMWRMVFFDIEEKKRRTRNSLTKYLRQLGMVEMQESVYVSPYDITAEVKYIRELLDIANNVKIGEMSKLENSEELRELFKV
jgi:DNA-binding transcriptional regulator PaaX